MAPPPRRDASPRPPFWDVLSERPAERDAFVINAIGVLPVTEDGDLDSSMMGVITQGDVTRAYDNAVEARMSAQDTWA